VLGDDITDRLPALRAYLLMMVKLAVFVQIDGDRERERCAEYGRRC